MPRPFVADRNKKGRLRPFLPIFAPQAALGLAVFSVPIARA